MDTHDMPIGLGFSLAQHPDAMKNFSNLSEAGQAEVVQRARRVSSKREMESLVRDLELG